MRNETNKIADEIAENIFQVAGYRLGNPTQQPVSGGDISKAFVIGDRLVFAGF